MPFKKSKNKKKKDATKEKSDSEDIDFECEVSVRSDFFSLTYLLMLIRNGLSILLLIRTLVSIFDSDPT